MKFLISGYTGLGNFVLKTPLFKAIKNQDNEATIHIITDPSNEVRYLANQNPNIDQVYLLKAKASFSDKVSFFRQLKKQHYQAVFISFDASPNFLNLGSYLARIPYRVKHFKIDHISPKSKLALSRKLLMYPKTLPVPFIAGRHETDLNMDLLATYLNQPIDNTYSTDIYFNQDSTALEKFNLAPNNYILLQPSCANGLVNVKSWPTSYFIDLIRKIQQSTNRKIVLVGDQGDKAASIDPILNEIKDQDQLVVTAGQTNMEELLNLIFYAKAIICHDSSVMHFGDAMGKPLIALYGPTDAHRTKPLNPTSHLLFSYNEYCGILYNLAMTEPELYKQVDNQSTMSAITPKDVFSSLESLLN